jgi:hypothetical protein
VRVAYNHKNSDVAAAPGVTPVTRGNGSNKLIAANYDFKVVKTYFALSIDKGFGSAPLGNNSNPYGGTAPTASTDGNEILLGAVVPAGPGNLIATVMRKDDRTRFNQDARSFGIGYLYSLSKRTTLYTVYGFTDNENGAGYTVANNTEAGSGDREIAVAGVALGMSVALGAQAAYPEKTITVVVPFPAGGSTDAIARAMARRSPRASTSPGSSTTVRARPAPSAPRWSSAHLPDGYTLLAASIGVYVMNPWLNKALTYDPSKDFDLLTVAVRAPNVLVASSNVKANTVQELIAYLKQNPGKVSFASSGNGSSDHLTAELFWQKTGTSGLHVPYKGGAPAITDLLGGQTDVSFVNINTALALHQGRQAEGAGRHGRAPRRDPAESADPRRSRRAGRRHLLVAGLRRTERAAEGREGQAAWRHRRRAQRTGHQGQAGRAGLRGRRQHA